MDEVDYRELNAAALDDDVLQVARNLRALVGAAETGVPDGLLPAQDEWTHLSEQQRRIAVQIWYFAESSKSDVARRTQVEDRRTKPDSE